MSMNIEQKHYDAFNYWFSCTQEGDTITEALNRTAEKFEVTPRTARNWYDKMNWKKMSQRRLRQIQKELEKRDNRTYAKNQKKYLDILHRLLYEYVEDGLPGKIESVRDLEIVIKNSLLLQNQPTEVVKQDNHHTGEIEVEVDAQPLFNKDRMREILEKEERSQQNNE